MPGPAVTGGLIQGDIPPAGLDAIRSAIRAKYASVAVSAEGKFSYPTGRAGAEALGYDSGIIRQAPSRLLKSYCGVGNPFSLGGTWAGAIILDYGSGAGFDLFVAGRLAGESGRIYGVDLTKAMVERSIINLSAAGSTNIDIRQIDGEQLPYPDDYFDLVISNGVINLSPFKSACFREFHRVLKPGGRLQFADIVLERDMPAEMTGNPEAWSQ